MVSVVLKDSVTVGWRPRVAFQAELVDIQLQQDKLASRCCTPLALAELKGCSSVHVQPAVHTTVQHLGRGGSRHDEVVRDGRRRTVSRLTAASSPLRSHCTTEAEMYSRDSMRSEAERARWFGDKASPWTTFANEIGMVIRRNSGVALLTNPSQNPRGAAEPPYVQERLDEASYSLLAALSLSRP